MSPRIMGQKNECLLVVSDRDISRNPLVCDCHLAQFVRGFNSIHNVSGTCREPEALSGLDVASILDLPGCGEDTRVSAVPWG